MLTNEIIKKSEDVIKLSRKVHEKIIKLSSCRYCEIDESCLKKEISINEEANPFDFFRFRRWFVLREYTEEYCKQKYKEIANRVLDEGVLSGLWGIYYFSPEYFFQLFLKFVFFKNKNLCGDCDCDCDSDS